MITKSLRQSFKQQEGQALVLACLMVLILSIAVITTVNLGHNVIERVKLQNSSDAAAYSMAAQEARAFNFYAFANRTQVSHYVTAMTIHSFLSMLFAIESWFTDLLGFVKSSIGACSPPSSNLFNIAFCIAVVAIPYIGQIIASLFTPIFNAMNTWANFLSRVFGPMEQVDRVVGRIVYETRWLNVIFAGASQAVFSLATLNQVAGSQQILIENDPNLASGLNSAFSLIAAPINACMFQRAHHKGAGIGGPGASGLIPANPANALSHTANADGDIIGRAKRSMGQIANGTRYAADIDTSSVGGGGSPYYVTKRDLATGLLPSFLGSLRGPIQSILSLATGKYGQTRALAGNVMPPYRSGSNNDISDRAARANKIRDPGSTPTAQSGSLASGDMLGADDPYYIGLPDSPVLRNPLYRMPFLRCRGGDPVDECWGDPNYDERDSRGVINSVFEPSIWAMNKDQAVKAPQAPNRKGLHFRTVPMPPQGNPTIFTPQPNWNIFARAGIRTKDVCVTFIPCSRWNPLSIEWTVYTANIQPIFDGNHQWHGITPFPHFEPGQYSRDCGLGFNDSAAANAITGRPAANASATAAREFNQPSSWVLANKSKDMLKNPLADPTASYNKPALLNDTGKISMGLSGAGTELDLDNSKQIGVGPLQYSGMGVISRAQTYYHRPGNWAEQPNFFNPYWRPRLAPVWQGAYSLPLINQIKGVIPGPLQNVPQKLLVH